MNSVKGKTAIITGAASGIGRGISLLLGEHGVNIAVADLNEAGGNGVADEIKAKGGKSIFVKHDVTSENSWNEIIKKTVAKFGKLDICVNCAGIGLIKSIENTSLEDWRKVLSINLEGVFLGTKSAMQAMKKSGGGSIVNIASTAGINGIIDNAAYCASKAGVRIFTRAAALECSKKGYDYNIRVNCIIPGIIETALSKAQWDQDKSLRKIVEDLTPVGHVGEPLDIANGVLYLVSDEAKFVTGIDLIIDGGFMAG